MRRSGWSVVNRRSGALTGAGRGAGSQRGRSGCARRRGGGVVAWTGFAGRSCASRPAGRAAGWRRPRRPGRRPGQDAGRRPGTARGVVGAGGSGRRRSARSFQAECRRPSTPQRTRASDTPVALVPPADQLTEVPDPGGGSRRASAVRRTCSLASSSRHEADCKPRQRRAPRRARAETGVTGLSQWSRERRPLRAAARVT